MDKVAPEVRSRIMSRVRNRDTGPERTVRSLLHRLGLRFRLHRKDLPGTPDIVLPGRRTVVFVHGCFWHGHRGCSRAVRPSSNRSFWEAKLNRNVERDTEVRRTLRRLGWRVIVVWECETCSTAKLERRLEKAFS